MCSLTRGEKEIIANALMAYKRELRAMADRYEDWTEYNEIEIQSVDELAQKLDLNPDYYEMEKGAVARGTIGR